MLSISIRYPSTVMADDGGLVYYQQQVLTTVGRSVLGLVDGQRPSRPAGSHYPPERSTDNSDNSLVPVEPEEFTLGGPRLARADRAGRRQRRGVAWIGLGISPGWRTIQRRCPVGAEPAGEHRRTGPGDRVDVGRGAVR